MRLTSDGWLRTARLMIFCLIVFGLVMAGNGQAVGTTTVQGTVYLANGQPGGGTLTVSWPAFTTAAGQMVAADRTSVTIGSDGFVSINLAPNQGSLPAGEYYTAVFYMSDGSVSTQYWIVPAAAQATLAQIQAQVMPAAQAVQAVSKAYVDEEISELTQSLLTASGGNLTGPLYLNEDPTQALQAADKHYVDSQVATAVPLAGGNMNGPLTTPGVNGVEAPAGAQQTTLQATVNAAGTNGAMEIPPTYAGTDTFTNPNGVRVTDMRTSVAQQIERSVKEFGAVCDGVTDDTNALQSAINYAQAHGVALTIPEGTCKTRTLNWHGESIGGLGKQVSALMGFPGQDVLATTPDSPNILSYTRLHDLTIYVDQSQDVSCSPAEGREAAGSCQVNRPMESNTIFSPGGNGLKGTAGSGAGWTIGNCAIAMQATTGTGGNGLKNAQIENLEIVATGTDPMATQYSGAHSTHTCGVYLAQWPQWSEFKNIDIRGLNTGVAIPALPVATPAGLIADSNRWQNITIQATHGFTAAAGCNGILDDVTAMAGNSAATGEPPTGIILDLQSSQEGWTVRNAVVMPNWTGVQPALTVTAATGAVTGVAVGAEHGLGWDPYGTTVPVAFSGSCTAQANAAVNNDGSIGAISVTQGGSGCSSTTTASINAPGNWDTAAPVNLIGGQNMTFFAGSLLRGHGGYTVWNATGAQSYGTQVNGGGGNLPGGGSYPAFIANNSVGSTLQVDQFPGVDFGAKLQACVNAVNSSFGGTCDARNFTGSQTMSANLTISTPNVTVLLPCATITTANQVIVTAGTRNVALRGCAMRGGSAASGSQGGTAFAYSGTGAVVEVGDPTYAVDTPGFHMDNSVINTTASTSAAAQGLAAYRTQEIDLEDMYFLGTSNQTGMTLDGTGNYAGGTIRSVQFDGFKTAVNSIGHQVANPATTDWMNASTFVRLHIDCPTSNGSPIAGTIGINLQQGDGNTFTGGDVEGCATALHLGPNAQNNTIIGLRNENSTSQVVADAGSSYNNWITGGTMFTGQLTDNGTRNSFQDSFHRSFNGMNGDWYGSQQDSTVTNHFRLGTGAGNERGLLNEYQTDFGYRWTEGLSDATGGEQFYQILDQMNNVYRLSIGQYNNGQSSTNNQTAMNSAGTGAVVLNSTSNSGTGGVIFGSGGANPSTVATINNGGNAQFNGTLQVGGTAQSTGTLTVRNNADAEVDYYLWPGLTASQKGSFTYKDWNGNSQWYMVKDASNNWALNSATGGLDSFKAYQSTNSGDTYVNASNSSGHIRFNYETGSGAETDIYSGSSSNLVASFLGPTSVKLPGLAASTGHNCLQIDNSGYITNTGVACGSGNGNGTVSTGTSGQIAYYTTSGTSIAGVSAVPVTAGGTGSTSAGGAITNLLPGVATDGSQGVTVTGNVAANIITASSTVTTGLQVAHTGTTMTGNQGNGVFIQHSTGTVTSGDLTSFDGNGNAIDSSIPKANVAQNGSAMTPSSVASTGPVTAPAVNNVYAVGGVGYASVTAALSAAAAHSWVENGLGTFGGFTNSSNVPVQFPDAAHFNAGLLFPEEWGAYGDGTHDDAAAVNACVTYSGSLKLKCVLLAGTSYLIQSASITMPTRSWLSGSNGADSHASVLKCEITPCIAIAHTGPIKGIHLSEVDLEVDDTIPSSVGIDWSSDATSGTFVEQSNIENVQIDNPAGQGIRVAGASTTSVPFQFNSIRNVVINGPASNHTGYPLVELDGQIAQTIFENMEVNGDGPNSANYPVLVSVAHIAGAAGANTLIFLNDTLQGAGGGMSFSNCQGVLIKGGNFENVTAPFTVTQCRPFDIDGTNLQNTTTGSWGPVVTDNGSNTGTIRNVAPTWGAGDSAPNYFMTCNQSGNTSAWQFEGIMGSSTWQPNTSNCVGANYSTASTVTLYTTVAVFAGDNGATPIQTINSLLPPGTIHTIQASNTGWVALSSGGNISLGTQPSPLMIPPGGSVNLVARDVSGNYKYVYLDPSPQGGVTQGDTDAGDGTFSTAVGSLRGCMASRYWTGTGTLGATSATYNFVALCPQANGNVPLVYTAGPAALNATLTWTSLGGLMTTASGGGQPVTLPKLNVPVYQTGSTSQTQIDSVQIPANTVTTSGTVKAMYTWGGCTGYATPFPTCGELNAVTGISGSGLSGSGTVLLSNFNNGCTGATATVTLTSGAYSSATTTANGTSCTAAPTSASCTSGTATCPTTVTVTTTGIGGNTGTCTPEVYLAATNTGQNFVILTSPPAIPAAKFGFTTILVQQQNSLNSEYAQQGTLDNTAATATAGSFGTVNMGNNSYLNVYMQNSVPTDQCFETARLVQAYP